MIQNRLTLEAEAGAQRYTLLLDSWRAMFSAALRSRDFGTNRSSIDLIQEAYAAADTFLEAEREHIFRVVDEIASEAHTASVSVLRSDTADALSPAQQEHLDAIESYLTNELVAQVHRDIAQIRSSLRAVVLRVKTQAAASGKSERIALVEYLIDSTDRLDFTFSDRSARRWDSKKFIRALWRQTLLAVYNEVTLHVIAEHGLTLADVSSPEGIKQTISIAYSPDHELYDDVRNQLFHPNSNNFLVPHVPA